MISVFTLIPGLFLEGEKCFCKMSSKLYDGRMSHPERSHFPTLSLYVEGQPPKVNIDGGHKGGR